MKSFVIVSCLLAVVLALPSNNLQPRKSSALLKYPINSRLTDSFKGFVGRVSDGLNAAPGQAPYACSIRWGITNRSHSCGASLLNDSWFISAAHCFTMGTGSNDIQCGVTDRLADVATQQIRSWDAADVHFHPGFTGSIYSDDVVIIRVSQPFTLNNLVQPIRLRSAGISDHNIDGRIFGWGSRDGSTSGAQNNLQTAEMDIFDAATCRTRMNQVQSGLTGFITDNDICAARGTYSVCAGDSGSPLVLTENGVDTLIGLAVWGLNPCGRTDGAPSVFSRISAYTAWVEGVIGQSLS